MATRGLKVQPDCLREYEQLINSYYVATYIDMHMSISYCRDSFIFSKKFFSVCTLN